MLQQTASAFGRTIVLSLALVSDGALADEPTLTFPRTTVAYSSLRNYICEDRRQVSVAYVGTADGDAFAYLPVEGRPHIFVRVQADSGNTYVSGPYVWATAGTHGSLRRIDDEAAAPLLGDCAVVARPASPTDDRIEIGSR